MKLKRNLSLLAAIALALVLSCSHAREEMKGPKTPTLPMEQISEITYERIFGCLGECPMYKVVLRKDGTASYIGLRYAERKGNYRSSYNEYYFTQTAKLISRNEYLNFKEQYGPSGEDEGYIITSVAYGDQRKTIKNYGSEGPMELWSIEMALEGAMSQIRWEKEQ
ncbi:MAG: hypothetical protein QOE96_1461 [Blastocatellia bacterium]|nr:hypothetical protein [Blastocatellia bacterium]